MKHFFKWSPLLSNDSSLCQNNTKCQHNTRRHIVLKGKLEATVFKKKLNLIYKSNISKYREIINISTVINLKEKNIYEESMNQSSFYEELHKLVKVTRRNRRANVIQSEVKKETLW